jgi:hypothetical protein
MKLVSDLCGLVGLTLLFMSAVAVSDDSWIENADTGENTSMTSMTDYALKLGLIRGHLWVANEMVVQGHLALGGKHSKHPAQEVYKELEPLFESIDSEGFADKLELMAISLQNKEVEDFQSAYLEVVTAISLIYPKMSLTVSQELEVTLGLLKQALTEYKVGVIEGAVVDLQEYQDARGFTHIAEESIRLMSDHARTQIDKGHLLKLQVQFSTVYKLWPSLIGDVAIKSGSDPLSELVQRVKKVKRSYEP